MHPLGYRSGLVNSPFVHAQSVSIRWSDIPDALPALARLPRLQTVSVMIDGADSIKYQWKIATLTNAFRFPTECRGIEELNTLLASVPPGCADELLPKCAGPRKLGAKWGGIKV